MCEREKKPERKRDTHPVAAQVLDVTRENCVPADRNCQIRKRFHEFRLKSSACKKTIKGYMWESVVEHVSLYTRTHTHTYTHTYIRAQPLLNRRRRESAGAAKENKINARYHIGRGRARETRWYLISITTQAGQRSLARDPSLSRCYFIISHFR